VVEHLPSICKVLAFITITAKKKKSKKVRGLFEGARICLKLFKKYFIFEV
jgi:hypothetical protein